MQLNGKWAPIFLCSSLWCLAAIVHNYWVFLFTVVLKLAVTVTAMTVAKECMKTQKLSRSRSCSRQFKHSVRGLQTLDCRPAEESYFCIGPVNSRPGNSNQSFVFVLKCWLSVWLKYTSVAQSTFTHNTNDIFFSWLLIGQSIKGRDTMDQSYSFRDLGYGSQARKIIVWFSVWNMPINKIHSPNNNNIDIKLQAFRSKWKKYKPFCFVNVFQNEGLSSWPFISLFSISFLFALLNLHVEV